MSQVKGYTARIRGHKLVAEGALFGWDRASGKGWAKCECGARKQVPSSGAAKRWHRDHKAEVAAATPTPEEPR